MAKYGCVVEARSVLFDKQASEPWALSVFYGEGGGMEGAFSDYCTLAEQAYQQIQILSPTTYWAKMRDASPHHLWTNGVELWGLSSGQLPGVSEVSLEVKDNELILGSGDVMTIGGSQKQLANEVSHIIRRAYRLIALQYDLFAASACALRSWDTEVADRRAKASGRKRRTSKSKSGNRLKMEARRDLIVHQIKTRYDGRWHGTLTELRKRLNADAGHDVSESTLSRYLTGMNLVAHGQPRRAASVSGKRTKEREAVADEPSDWSQIRAWTMSDDDADNQSVS